MPVTESHTPHVARRRLLGWLAAGAALPVLAACGSKADARAFPVAYSEAAWRKRLNGQQFHILREKGTEYPGTSALLNEHRNGTFSCIADGNPLFASTTKFDSGTGWPSFWKPLPGAVVTASDFGRTEVLCARCGGHLGHVFDDGPAPTGLRYCMNGVALAFKAG